MAFFAEAQGGGLSARETFGRAGLRVASVLGNKAVFDEMIKDGEDVFSGKRADITPDQMVTMAEVTAAHAVAGTLRLDRNWVETHDNPWAPQPATHEPQTPRVRVPSSTMGLDQRQGRPASH